MSCHKKDYEAIASIIQSTTITVDQTRESLGIQKVLVRKDFINGLCAYFKQDNPRFDEDKFKKATEPDEPELSLNSNGLLGTARE